VVVVVVGCSMMVYRMVHMKEHMLLDTSVVRAVASSWVEVPS